MDEAFYLIYEFVDQPVRYQQVDMITNGSCVQLEWRSENSIFPPDP